MTVTQRIIRAALVAGLCFGTQWFLTRYFADHLPPWLAGTLALLVAVQLGFLLRSVFIRHPDAKKSLAKRWYYYNLVALSLVGLTAVLVDRFSTLGQLQAVAIATVISGFTAFLIDEFIVFR